jgi:isopenicillin-N N-acyltransferase-like protein
MTSIRLLELQGTDPKKWGEQHGESFRDDIRRIAEIRMTLTLGRTDLASRDNVLALARHHLPVLERFDRALYDELCGIARGAGLTPEEIVVVNHYTDLRDLTLADLHRLDEQAGKDPGGCSALFLAGDGAKKHRLLGQTWDMHGSAEPYALLIKVPAIPDGHTVEKTNQAGIPKYGSTLVFSITGCLGMTGLSSWGVGLTINNLNSVDATVGVVWPALVRKTLRQPSAKAMKDTILSAPIGSGRHYIVADKDDVFGIETSGTKKKVIKDGGSAPYFHTNHCVDDEMKGTCRILPGSTTVQRYETLTKMVAEGPLPDDLRSTFDAFAPVGLKQNPKNPHDVATCGAIVMDLTDKNAMACVGIPGPDADSIVVEVR